MRVLVFYDMPNQTDLEKREYRYFRTYLIKSGFIMLQESVYGKLALNGSVVESIRLNLRKNKPKCGLVQILALTEKQFSDMEFLVGSSTNDVLDTIDRLVVL